MRKGKVALWIAALAISFLTAPAGAAVVELSDDPNGMPDWQGIQEYTGLLVGQQVWDAYVSYCVYEPGRFADSFGFDPAPGQYVYAYQITELNGGFTLSTVDIVSVGLNGGDEEAGAIGFVDEGGSAPPEMMDPSSYQVDLSTWSAKWHWKDPDAGPLRNGNTSPVLHFASDYGPEWDTVRLQGWGGDTRLLPSPTPEPASATLLLVGLGIVLVRRRRR